jgi:hypothetical protein
MTQRVRVSGGYTGEVSAVLRDEPEMRDAADLSLAAIKVCLVEVGSEAPDRTSVEWLVPSTLEYPQGGIAILTLSVTEARGLGRYYLYALATMSPLSIPVRAGNEVVELF